MNTTCKEAVRMEVINKALLESVGGGKPGDPACKITCSLFSWDWCEINVCVMPVTASA